MIASILYIFLALLGIGFLVFIHELGHYFMARKVGVIVEVFAIGFGKPILKWERDGVKWQVGMIPFGGYVQMKGESAKGSIEAHKIKGGFMAQSPWNRIKIAFMGPLVNIVFTFLAFALLWIVGGREKPFSEFTSYIGWVKKESPLYQADIRPGDRILTLNGRPFQQFNDFLYGAMLDDEALKMTGDQIDYNTGAVTQFAFTVADEEVDPQAKVAQIQGSLLPASYLVFNETLAGSPLEGSGLETGDRILWADGHRIFSQHQLKNLLNNEQIFVTIKRGDQILHTRIPRLQIKDLRLSASEKEELDDWKVEANLTDFVDELHFIPYNLSPQGVVQSPLGYIDEDSQPQLLYKEPQRLPQEAPLQIGDQIIAIQGEPVSSSYDLMREIQTKKSLIMISTKDDRQTLLWKEADKGFQEAYTAPELVALIESIGTGAPLTQRGDYTLLKPFTPRPLLDYKLSPEKEEKRQEALNKQEKAIEAIKDPKEKAIAQKAFAAYKSGVGLGVLLQDRAVKYNPSPFLLFGDVFEETFRTLGALFSGYLSPKNLSGPVGIIQVIHHGWTQGIKEALFWLGMISLNLGILNLLPVPPLDGGHIVFAIWEAITKKPISSKTKEKLIIPFVVLFIGLLIYMTYHDIVRLVSQLFS